MKALVVREPGGVEVRDFKPGDRVATAQRYHICGACRHCRTGYETLCPDRKFLGDWGMVGGHAGRPLFSETGTTP